MLKSQKTYAFKLYNDLIISVTKGPKDIFITDVSNEDSSVKASFEGVFTSAIFFSMMLDQPEFSEFFNKRMKKKLSSIKMKKYMKQTKFAFNELIYMLTGGNETWNSEEYKSKGLEFDAEVAKDIWYDSLWECVFEIETFDFLVEALNKYKNRFISAGFGNYVNALKRNKIQ